MARRKKELLELLHSQKKSESLSSRKEVPVAPPAPSAPSQIQLPRGSLRKAPFPKGLLLIAVPFLLIALVWAFGGNSGDSGSNTVNTTTAPSPPVPVVNTPAVPPAPFAVLAITYGETGKDKAIRAASQLKKLGFPSVVALATPTPSNPKFFEIWIGEEESADALQALLKRVQQTELSDRKGKKPFQTANIRRRTKYTP